MATRPRDPYGRPRVVGGIALILAAIVMALLGVAFDKPIEFPQLALFLGTGTVLLGAAAAADIIGRGK